MADAFFTEQHELVRKLAREFAETELTKEVLVENGEIVPAAEPVITCQCLRVPVLDTNRSTALPSREMICPITTKVKSR